MTLVHEGLVPGRGGASGLATRPRVHDHESEDGLAGLVSLQGVKYTTGRAVAEQGIDLVLRRLGRSPVPSRTAHTVLAGARVLTGPLEGRVRQAVREEMALTLSDAVLRRLDLGTGGAPTPGDLDARLHRDVGRARLGLRAAGRRARGARPRLPPALIAPTGARAPPC